MTTVSDAEIEVREGTYGDKVIAVEPGGAEFIPLKERHGRPLQLFWTWSSPNMEFATIFVGVLAVAAFGLGFWEAVLAIVLGSGLDGDDLLAIGSFSDLDVGVAYRRHALSCHRHNAVNSVIGTWLAGNSGATSRSRVATLVIHRIRRFA